MCIVKAAAAVKAGLEAKVMADLDGAEVTLGMAKIGRLGMGASRERAAKPPPAGFDLDKLLEHAMFVCVVSGGTGKGGKALSKQKAHENAFTNKLHLS